MVLAIAAALTGAASPQIVRVSVTGMTPGVPFELTGSLASGFSWTVPGGDGQLAPAATATFADVAAPLNDAITYVVRQDEASATSSPIVVPSDLHALQTPDGRLAVRFAWQDNADPRATRIRAAVFEVPGRVTPVVRWDLSAGESGELTIRTARTGTEDLRQILRTRGPVLVLRTAGQVLDLAPVEVIVVRSATRDVIGFDGERLWRIVFDVIDAPELSTALAASSGDDFDAAYAALTWTDFDAEWASLTGDDFDATDWSAH